MVKILAAGNKNEDLLIIKNLLSAVFTDIKLFLTLNSKEAIEICSRENPDLILLDQDMDGYEICQLIKKETLTHFTPVIMINGAENGKESRIKALDCGADGFIAKPIDGPELIAQVKAMLRIKESTDRMRSEKIPFENLGTIPAEALEKKFTEQKKIEETLLYEQYLMNSFMDNTPDSIYFKDLQCHFLRINKALAERIGLANPISAIGKSDFDFFTAEHAQQAFADEQEIIKTGKPIIDKEEKETWIGGKETWVSTTKMPFLSKEGKIIGTLGISRDITQRIKAGNQTKILNRTIEQSPVSIIITDCDGNIEYTNPKFTEVTGYSFEEVRGKNPRILKSSTHPVEYYKNLWDTLLSGHIWRGEFLNKRKNNELFWESAVICPILDDKNQIINIIGIKDDITQKKKMLAELIQTKDKAEENDRLKTAFIHNISHEIRTPMNAIIGFSEFLNNDALTSEKRSQIIQIITQNCNELLSIINDIVSISTVETGQEQISEDVINLNKIITAAYNQHKQKAATHNILFDYSLSLPDDKDFIVADESKLIQILNYLLNNAFKFTPKGHIKFGYKVKGKFIEFFVEDTGIGVSPEMHSEIFKLFRQVEYSHTRKFGGSGLGLTISKAYVELMGGKIWIDSQKDKGSSFHFTIPYLKGTYDLKTEEFLTDQSKFQSSKPIAILAAEDEDFNFLLLKEILSNPDITLTRAENGQQVVDIFKKDPSFDLILMDLKMPILDGYEATKIIREFNSQIPIIALTAYTLNSDKETALNCGCNDFISKPFKQKLLWAKIQEYIDKPLPTP
jgi:PAS domain S-box-containing protein